MRDFNIHLYVIYIYIVIYLCFSGRFRIFNDSFRDIWWFRRRSWKLHIVGWMQERPISAPVWRTTYLGARFKNDLSQRPIQERPISAPGPRTTYLGARLKNDLSRRPVEERPISAQDSRTTYLKRDFCFSDIVVAALRDFKIRLL